MIPSLGVESSRLRSLLVSRPELPPVDTGSRDATIRITFAAFDTSAHLSDPLPEDARDRGVWANTIDEHLKCIFGLTHDALLVGLRAAQYIDGVACTEHSAPHALSISRLTALAAFYIGLCQERAFNADGDFDTVGLIDFIVARLALSQEALTQALTGSTPGASVFMAMRRSPSARQLSIYDSEGQDLYAPSPSLRFDGLPPAAMRNAYLRNVTIRMQTVDAVDLSAADLSGAYIEGSAFEGVLLHNANLSNAFFKDFSAKQCTFTTTDLSHATFRDAQLNHVEFRDCQMTAVSFHATGLESTRFERCDLQNMTLDNETHFEVGTRASIDKSEFQACNMTSARLRHLQWSDGGIADSRLWDATISDSGFTRATWGHQLTAFPRPPLSGATFSTTQFRACVMTQLNANESRWSQCLFENGRLAGSSWQDSTLRTMRFGSVDMQGVRFDNSVCENLRIDGACDFDRVSFANAKLTDVRFDAAQSRIMLRLNSIDFSRAALDDVHFTKCQMVSAKFTQAQICNVQFSRCNLNHSDFNRSQGGDLLRMLMSNRMKRYRAEGMITAVGDIGSLAGRARRNTLLNHVSHRDSLLANILSGLSGSTTASLVLHIADRLLREAHDPIDSDTWMIAALAHSFRKTRGLTAIRARIDVHLFRMLQRHLPELNDLGLRTRPAHRWGLDAVEHLCRLLHSKREQPGVLWRNSPLIAVISTSVYIGAITLSRPTQALLAEARWGIAPADLRQAFGELTGNADLALPHATLLTPDGQRAVILLPARSAAILGVRPDPLPVAANSAYSAIKAIDGTWQFGQSETLDAAFAPFPLIAAALHPRAALLQRLIEGFELPADLMQYFKNGLIQHHRHNLCGANDQHRLANTFRPLLTSMRNAPSGCDLAPWIANNLLPLEIHQYRVYTALADLYVVGDPAANGILAWGLATLYFRAASAEIFGLPENSPQFLRYYAFAWVNQAIRFNPELLGALGGPDVYHEIASHIVGSSQNDFSCCAAVIGARLTETFGHPLLLNHPHARRVRADLCG